MDPNIQIWTRGDGKHVVQVGREQHYLTTAELMQTLRAVVTGEGVLPPCYSITLEEASKPRNARGVGGALPTPKPDPNVLPVLFNLGEARDISERMADLLCWHRGYAAARPEDNNSPMGVEGVRRAREHIMRALNLAAGAADADLPF